MTKIKSVIHHLTLLNHKVDFIVLFRLAPLNMIYPGDQIKHVLSWGLMNASLKGSR